MMCKAPRTFTAYAKATRITPDAITKTGLNVAAWKVERVASIGKSQERREYQANGNGDAPSHRKQGSGHSSRDNDLNDPLPF